MMRTGLITVLAGVVLGGVALAAGPAPNEIAAAEAAAFTEADANGDGVLAADEFANFHDLLRRRLDALHFARLDANEDGVLTLDEIRSGRPAGPPPLGPPL